MLKRIIAVIMALAMGICALAEALPEAEDVQYLTCVCGKGESCTCFAKYDPEDDTCSGYLFKAVNDALISAGYLAGESSYTFSEDTYTAVCAFQTANGLPADGRLTDETLTLLFGTEPGGAFERLPYYRVPVHGGEKLHADADCSGMLEPCIISVNNGAYLIEQGYTEKCGNCFD